MPVPRLHHRLAGRAPRGWPPGADSGGVQQGRGVSWAGREGRQHGPALSLGLRRQLHCRASDVRLAGELSPQWPGRWPAASSPTHGRCRGQGPRSGASIPAWDLAAEPPLGQVSTHGALPLGRPASRYSLTLVHTHERTRSHAHARTCSHSHLCTRMDSLVHTRKMLTHTHGLTHALTHTHGLMHTHTHMDSCTHAHTWTHAHTHAWTRSCTHTRAYAQTRTHLHAWPRCHTRVRAQAHTLVHTHRHALALTRGLTRAEPGWSLRGVGSLCGRSQDAERRSGLQEPGLQVCAGGGVRFPVTR